MESTQLQDRGPAEGPGRGEPREVNPLEGGRILVVDDDPSMCEFVEGTLQHHDLEVTCRTSAVEALELARSTDYDLILTDLSMAEMGGIELCEHLVGMRPDVPVIVVTGYGSLESAIAAIRVGAYDYITKPVDPKLLLVAVSRALQHRRLREEVKRLRRAVGPEDRFEDIVGQSSAMRRVFEMVNRVAESDTTVLITGESGTGKELVAKALHDRSPRNSGPFLAINCAAVPQSLIESELFGHVRGAFTDAKVGRTGLFAQADGGTLFLDEIGELPLDVQPKLLRALQERRVRPVGGSNEVTFDARIIAATNADLEAEVDARRFRQDLYYRINVVRVDVPPLRDRAGDALLLAQHFIQRFAARSGKKVEGLAAPAAEKILAYHWPGNVRELENCMERAVALTQFNQVTVDDLPEKVRSYQADRLVVATDDPSDLMSLKALEQRYVMKVLALVGGNKSRAADILQVDRRTLYRKLDRYGSKS